MDEKIKQVMNPHLKKLQNISQKEYRRIVGLMSGTSMDGLDIALGRFSGTGRETRFEQEYFKTVEYPPEVRQKLIAFSTAKCLDPEHLCVWNTYLAHVYGGYVNEALDSWGIPKSEIDLIASHGQTLYHAPKHKHNLEGFPNTTMQIGDGDHLAHLTGIITISDFRQRDTARGNEGAPLAGYGDYLLFSDPETSRVLLNIGGIANFTYLEAGSDRYPPLSSDTGPGNTLIDAAIRTYYDGLTYDRDGGLAARGEVHKGLLSSLKDHPFFKKTLPRTTGLEVFHLDWVQQCIDTSGFQLRPEDLLATLTRLTIETIADAIRGVIPGDASVTCYVSGGGIYNKTLMKGLAEEMKPLDMVPLSKLGMHADAKEALFFAALANELVCGEDTRRHFGKICLPD